jgi:Xaa-Pro aminopeptidase
MAKNPPYPAHPLPVGAKPTKELLKYVPQLSLAERNRRWDGIRKKMMLANIDVLLILANDAFWDMGLINLRYITQVCSKMGAHALFFIDRDPIIWNSLPHMNRPTSLTLSTQEWVSDIRPYGGVAEVAAAVREAGLDQGRIGMVSFGSTIVTTPTLLHGDVLNYQKELPKCQFSDVNWLIEQMRMIKSEEEIAMLAKAGEICLKTVEALIEHARPGITEAALYAELIRTQIANGAEPQIFHLLASGPVEHPTTELWHLLHGAEQPLVPTMRPIQSGDIVVTEFHSQYGGYLAATEFTVYVGKKAPPQLLDIHKACVEALQISLEVLRPGNTLRNAWESIRMAAEKRGFDFVELGFHGHGLGSPEFPTVVYRPGFGPSSMNGDHIGDLMFEENMVFGNNIDIFNPKWKPDVGCMFGDMVVLRKDGAHRLVNVPLELPQVG